MPPIDPVLERLAVQHARTAQLLGVDFVPAFRSPGSGLGEPTPSAIDTVTAAPSRVPAHAPVSAPAPVPAPRRGEPRDAETVRGQLLALRRRYETDAPHARFETPFTNIVFGEGDPCARLLFVGEAPGEDEDKTGRPFVGRAGQLLEKMIVAMGLTRERVYICNVLKTRPPNNRPPTPDETLASAPYLYEQIATVQPEAIVTLGRPATHLLLGVQDAMGRLRGRWAEFRVPEPPQGFQYGGAYTGLSFPVMPTYHPSFLLRAYTDENRKAVWSDLKQVLELLGLTAPGAPGNRPQ